VDPSALPDPDDCRPEDPAQRGQHRTKYQRLTDHWAFPFAAQVLNLYVPSCVPSPPQTERTFWSVSAMPGTNRVSAGGRLCTLSINKMETLFLVAGEVGSNRYLGGVVNLSLRHLQSQAGPPKALKRAYPDLEFRQPSYESGGGDVVSVVFRGLEGYFGVWDIPGALEAARTLNLMLMRAKAPRFCGAGTATTWPTGPSPTPTT
jgi:hypothetical protein